MVGRIDRLAVHPETVLAIDFKTDRAVPERPEAVPTAYLAQLAAYRTALASVFPGRRIEAALLWSAVPRLMPLPEDALAAAMAAAAVSLPRA
jgi:ATP-dependent helicase/nuclease subunit A